MKRDAAADVRRSLVDPVRLCAALRLLGGAQRQARGVLIRCPSHGERNPSCSVTLGPDGTIRVRCFACDFAGDALTLVALVERLDLRRDFGSVLREAARIAGIDVDDDGGPRSFVPPPPAQRVEDVAAADVVPFSAIAAPLLHLGRLDDGPVARDVAAYLRARGLLDEARADGWAALAPDAASLLLETFDEHAIRAGLVTHTRTFRHPENRLAIPWRDRAGSVVTLQRRRLDGGDPKYVFPPGRAARDPYGVELLADAPADAPLAFVEGAIDVLALRVLFRLRGAAVVALGIPGVTGWRESWAALARGRAVLVATDADQAGEQAAERIASATRAAGAASVRRARPNGAKDWAELLAARVAA